MGICKFCGVDGPLTLEHLFPDWLRQALPSAMMSHYARRKGDGTINKWRTLSHSTTARIACGPCNNGWMSDIEGAAAPLLLPKILAATPGMLTLPEAAAVATWIYLKSLVIQTTTAPAVAPDQYYHDLFADRAPRPGTTVVLGALDGIDAATGFFVGAQIDAAHQGVIVSGYLATIGVGNLAARLIYVPAEVGQVGPITNPGFDNRLIKIWPGVGKAAWPPPPMDRASFGILNKTLPLVLIA
jgi:hypothetical protein